jgi:sulfatase maturation enzyme AslB (radical SAM superfamily)
MVDETRYAPGDFPQRITLELTNRCNLNCTFCPRKLMEARRGNMDLELAGRLIEEMAEHRPLQVVPFFRGESLLHPHWVSILSMIKKQNLGEIQFTTNASCFGEREAKQILDLGIDFISFSLDTLDAALYNRLRRGANYTRCLTNVLRFLDLREKDGAATRVQVSAVETDDTREGLKAFINYWRARVDRVRIYVEHSRNGYPGSIDASFPNSSIQKPCRKVFTDMVIYWDGTVGLCNHDWTRPKAGPLLGDLNTSSITEVWKSRSYDGVRTMHLNGDVSGLVPCANCDHWKMYYTPSGFLGKTYYPDVRL